MANEKQINISFRISVGGITSAVTVNKSATLVGKPAGQRQQIATGSWQELELASLGNIERLAVKNEDVTNFVEFAFDNAGSNKLAKVVSGDGFYVPLPASTATLYAQADTAACWISFNACEA